MSNIEINLKFFIEDKELIDKKTLIRLIDLFQITPLISLEKENIRINIRKDKFKNKFKISYHCKYNLFQNKFILNSDIEYILRDYYLNKILND